MTKTDVEALGVSTVVLLLAVIAVVWLWWRRRDEEFTGVTPGLLPADPRAASTRRVRGGKEWKGTVAVAFSPPRGIGPAVAGTVVDGKVDARDLAAMLVDLSLRGWFVIEKLGENDWRLVPNTQAPQEDQLSPAEQRMMAALFPHGAPVLMSTLKQHFGLTLRQVQIDLYREMINRGWYRKHPRSRSSWTTVIGILLLIGSAVAAGGAYQLWKQQDAVYAFALPAATAVAAVLFFTLGRGRAPRTAEGTAARIQTLGFEKYLATAEADQIKFEEAAGLFTRYLPFAIVFGLADRWAKVIGDVMKRAQFDGAGGDFGGVIFDPMAWYAMDGVLNLAGDGIGALIDVASGVDIAGGLSDVTSAFGDFTSSASDVFSEADGCMDGCDGGCIDF